MYENRVCNDLNRRSLSGPHEATWRRNRYHPISHLNARIDTDGTTHHDYGDGNVATWTRREKLGEGGYGTVWREESEAGLPRPKLRAVKAIRKDNKLLEKSWRRELNTMVMFSKVQSRT